MFGKVLIANRGEIACRIIRACKRLNIGTVAVYSEADQDTLHVRLADEAQPLGASLPQESYLNMSRIIDVAQRSHADAIHPGYGFLSENPDFARACQGAGVHFIGPSPEVMAKMGDKVRARKLAREAGLPLLPGTNGTVDDSQAAASAWELGLPLMVKATQGGGGIGIRIINSLDDLKSVIQQERSLASNAFGSSHLYFERYLEGASHIEVQVLGDEHGHLVHLFERDCSIQRRNQKLVEESPTVKLAPEQRRRLWEYALKFAKHIGYTNAGTVEFLVSAEGEIYFLEMNTRLQVEHGVTEMITGLDIVELQLRVAAGEPLPITQDQVQARGHAIEARIYPEDPETFMPSAGVVRNLRQPEGEHVRVDSALFPGYEVTIFYESLMAKIICWGETREDAIVRLSGALDEFHVDGVSCNGPLIRNVLNHASFMDGTYHTGFLSTMARLPSGDVDIEASHISGNGRDDKELAVAIGVSLLLDMESGSKARGGFSGNRANSWKLYGRREQMLPHTLGKKGWR